MNPSRNLLKSISKQAAIAAVAGICLIAFLIGSVVPVGAQSDPTTTPPHPAAKLTAGQRLADIYKREQTALTAQQTNLDKGKKVASKAQDLINKAKGNGKDVSALEFALSTFNTQIASAQSTHNAAANILSTHSGFDANGIVTDPTVARNTIVTARDSLKDTRLAMRQAVLNLRTAVKKWRQENHPNKTSPASPSTTPAAPASF